MFPQDQEEKMRYLIVLCALICAAYDAHADPDEVPGLGMRIEATTERKCVQKSEKSDEAVVSCASIITKLKVIAVACHGPAHKAGVMDGDFVDSVGSIELDDGNMDAAMYQKFLSGASGQPAVKFTFKRDGVALFEKYKEKLLYPDIAFNGKNFTCGFGNGTV